MSTADPAGYISANLKVVHFHPLKCPACGSQRVRVTSTRLPVRQHKCKECGHPFKSVERASANREALTAENTAE